jgi:hypothetical protein
VRVDVHYAGFLSPGGVIKRLQADGYHVTAPQFPLTGLADDVARLRQVAMVSHPDEVAHLIRTAAEAVLATS